MNKIEVKNYKSKYMEEEHLSIFVDDIPLDVYISNIANDTTYIGLVSPFIDWNMSENEKNIIQNRLKSKDKNVKLPVLICCDDLDLYCTVIIVDVYFENNIIEWRKIGLESSELCDITNDLNNLGNVVKWFSNFSCLKFDKEQYEYELEKF